MSPTFAAAIAIASSIDPMFGLWADAAYVPLREDTYRHYRPRDEIDVHENAPVRDFETLKSIADQYLGVCYKSPGLGPGMGARKNRPCIDCSGFVWRVYAEAGYLLPRGSWQQATAGKQVALTDLRPGDLVFFKRPSEGRISHVALYVGDRQIMHASGTNRRGGRVKFASLDDRFWRVDKPPVAAVRILPETGEAPKVHVAVKTPKTHTSSTGKSKFVPPPVSEHSGEYALPITLRLASTPRPSYGPEIAWSDRSSIALRAATLTERNARGSSVLGLTLVPEATLFLESIGLTAAVAVPIRFEVGETPTVGQLDEFADWTRFVRELSVGLRGAELEVRFDRLGDITLARGMVVDRLAPGSGASGVPAMSVVTTPLYFYGGYRNEAFQTEVLVADVADPALFGASADVQLFDLIDVGVAFASDQKANSELARRAINAVEGSVGAEFLETREWYFSASVSSGAVLAQGHLGFGGLARIEAEYHPRRSFITIARLELSGGVLGSGFVDHLFGPTYLAARGAHFDALSSRQTRGVLMGEATVEFGKVVVGVGYGDGLGGDVTLDRRFYGLAEVRAMSLGGRRHLDLRAVYLARGLPGSRAEGGNDVLHGGARVSFSDWFSAELYVEEGQSLQGGLGLTVGWAP